jgi:hypothetical protein
MKRLSSQKLETIVALTVTILTKNIQLKDEVIDNKILSGYSMYTECKIIEFQKDCYKLGGRSTVCPILSLCISNHHFGKIAIGTKMHFFI